MFTDLRRDFKNSGNGGAGLQRAVRSALDHRSVGDRIGERYPQFDEIGAAAFERSHQSRCRCGRRISRGKVSDEARPSFLAQALK